MKLLFSAAFSAHAKFPSSSTHIQHHSTRHLSYALLVHGWWRADETFRLLHRACIAGPFPPGANLNGTGIKVLLVLK